MKIQRLRNLTTGHLHTNMGDIYEDIAAITGEDGIMTHQLPNAFRALLPWLKDKISDQRFFEDKHDPNHVGEFELPAMTPEEKGEFFQRFAKLPSPLIGKNVIVVTP